jgi:hypothetical protein
MYLCRSCGINTDRIGEYYMVHNELWKCAGLGNGMLCIRCLERRLGRRLHKRDFTRYPVNDGTLWTQSGRLRARLRA